MSVINPLALMQEQGILRLRNGMSGGTISGWTVENGALVTEGPQSVSRNLPYEPLNPYPWATPTVGNYLDVSAYVDYGATVRYRMVGRITKDPNITYVRVSDAYAYPEDFEESGDWYLFETQFEDDGQGSVLWDPYSWSPSISFSVGHSVGVATIEAEVTVEAELISPPPPVYAYYAYWFNHALEDGESCQTTSIQSITPLSARVDVYQGRRGSFWRDGRCVPNTITSGDGELPPPDQSFDVPLDSFTWSDWGDSWEIRDLYVDGVAEEDAIVFTMEVEALTDRGPMNSTMSALLGWGA